MTITKRRIVGVLTALAGLWLPFFIGMFLLPAGWLDGESNPWWAVPMFFTLSIAAVTSIVGGIVMVTTDSEHQ